MRVLLFVETVLVVLGLLCSRFLLQRTSEDLARFYRSRAAAVSSVIGGESDVPRPPADRQIMTHIRTSEFLSGTPSLILRWSG
jgi:hypothetical protein